MAAVKNMEAPLRRGDRKVEGFRKGGQIAQGGGAMHARTGDDQRTLCLAQHLHGAGRIVRCRGGDGFRPGA